MERHEANLPSSDNGFQTETLPLPDACYGRRPASADRILVSVTLLRLPPLMNREMVGWETPAALARRLPLRPS
jgi:hypothetical protein